MCFSELSATKRAKKHRFIKICLGMHSIYFFNLAITFDTFLFIRTFFVKGVTKNRVEQDDYFDLQKSINY